MNTRANPKKSRFVVIGSGGGGGTIAWMLAKAGHEVILLEQGPDLRKHLAEPSPNTGDPAGFNSIVHDEEVFRLRHPDPKRRTRGDYNTFRQRSSIDAKPFRNGWTGSSLGGGSVIWGAWAYRALPIDFKLKTHYEAEGQLGTLTSQGYSIADWPVSYSRFAPFYRIAEALFAVNGDRKAQNESVKRSAWYESLGGRDYLRGGPDWNSHWFPGDAYPGRPFPRTPVGQFVFNALEGVGMTSFTLATGIVSPDSGHYSTQGQLAQSLVGWNDAKMHPLWRKSASDLWTASTRDACNMCGYCGEFICWAKSGAKSGTQVSTIAELENMQANNCKLGSIITNARAVEVLYDGSSKRATGVRYLDTSCEKMDSPTVQIIEAEYVIVSCGAVQSARLLMMSNGPGIGENLGLGNSTGQLGRNATFHMFGLSVTGTLSKELQGLVRAEFGPTGNTSSFAPYFLRNPADGAWVKGGTLTSTSKKNPMENAVSKVERDALTGHELLAEMESHARRVEIRCTADDLPMDRNRVDLDPKYVDEYGFPVARLTRDFGPNEWLLSALMEKEFEKIGAPLERAGAIEKGKWKTSKAIVDLIGDHQMGTCRMGSCPSNSVLDASCRVWDAPNVFVVDASFMPTGLGLNPMMTVVANALRVGSWMIQHLHQGKDLATAPVEEY